MEGFHYVQIGTPTWRQGFWSAAFWKARLLKRKRRKPKNCPKLIFLLEPRATFIMMGIGGFSPLDGFMGKADWKSVCEKNDPGRWNFWPVPVTLDVSAEEAHKNKTRWRSRTCAQWWNYGHPCALRKSMRWPKRTKSGNVKWFSRGRPGFGKILGSRSFWSSWRENGFEPERI